MAAFCFRHQGSRGAFTAKLRFPAGTSKKVKADCCACGLMIHHNFPFFFIWQLKVVSYAPVPVIQTSPFVIIAPSTKEEQND